LGDGETHDSTPSHPEAKEEAEPTTSWRSTPRQIVSFLGLGVGLLFIPLRSGFLWSVHILVEEITGGLFVTR
jgi:hypothetical protein